MTYGIPVRWQPSGPNERPSASPKDDMGQTINEIRRRKARERAFEAEHGRKMSKKDHKRL
jgi:hypothetical protein